MKNSLTRVSNLLLYVAFCGLAGTGLLMKYRLPPGSRGGHGLTSLGLGRHEWGDIHLWLAWAVIATTVLHLVLNWRWLRIIAARRRWAPLAGGLAFGAAVLAMPLILPISRAGASTETQRAIPETVQGEARSSCDTCPSAAPGGECAPQRTGSAATPGTKEN